MWFLLIAGCAPCLLERSGRSCEDWPPAEDSADTGDTGEEEPAGPRVVSTQTAEGWETWVDATAYLEFVYLSLATGEEVAVSDPLGSLAWDLGFERYLVPSNGGVSGSGGVEAVAITDSAYEDLTTAPAEGYTSDQADDDDENQNPEYALGEWFDYSSDDHSVTPKDLFYVVHTVGGTYVKLQFLDYYDDAGSPAYITLRWAEVAAP